MNFDFLLAYPQWLDGAGNLRISVYTWQGMLRFSSISVSEKNKGDRSMGRTMNMANSLRRPMTTIMVRRVVAVLILGAPLILGGCGTYRWTEEVQVSDGRVLKVNRVEHYQSGGGIGDGCTACVLKDSRLEFQLDGREYIWNSSPFAESPMILDVMDGVPIVITTPEAQGYCSKDPQDKTKYHFYQAHIWLDGRLVRQYEVPGAVPPSRNLFYGHPNGSAINLHQKDKWLSETSIILPLRRIVGDAGGDPRYCGAYRDADAIRAERNRYYETMKSSNSSSAVK